MVQEICRARSAEMPDSVSVPQQQMVDVRTVLAVAYQCGSLPPHCAMLHSLIWLPSGCHPNNMA